MIEAAVLIVNVTVVFVLALLGVRLIRRGRAALRHLILASAFGAVAVLPGAMATSPSLVIEIPALPARAEPPAESPVAVGFDADAARIDIPIASVSVPSTTSERSRPVRPWWLLAWALVAVIACVPVGASVWRFGTIRRRGHAWPEGTAHLSGLTRGGRTCVPAVLLHDGIVAPVTGGLLRPAIVLPSEAVRWSDTHIENALVHELEHVRRYDWVVLLTARAICALYWFHPLVWMAWHRMRLEAERACDDAVLAHGDGPAYAEQLLGLARRLVQRPGPSLLSMANGSDLTSRITSVLDDTRPRGRAGRAAIAGIAAAATLTIVTLAPLRATGPMHEPAPIQSERAAPSLQRDRQPDGEGFSRRFASRDAAVKAGCRFAAVKGPSTEACVLHGFRDRTLAVAVYERSADGAFALVNEMAIPSWYETATLSLVALPATRADWIVVETEGMHGTGIFQRVLFVIGWDGSRFRTAAAESLDYRCVRPTSTMDYALHVRWAFEAAGGAPVLRLDYELTRDEQPIGRWSDRLRWNAAQFAFAPYQATHDVREPVAVRIRNQVGHVRVYSASRSMNPASGSDEWMSNSELMDVLSPACAPSLSMFAREFVGKWGLDPERTAAHSGGASPDAALIIGWDRRALTVIRPAGLREVYRFDGTTTSVPVGPVSGRATAVLEGERMVVTVIVPGNNQPVRRVYYLDGQSLVIEESGGADGTSTAAYYAKS